MTDLGEVTVDTFAPLVGERFVIRAADGSIDAVLLDATVPDRHGFPDTMRAPFSITFRGPTDPPLQQGMHAIGHDAIGELELFLVPIGKDSEGAPRYQAVFA